MTISLLAAVQAACVRSGIEPPASVIANADQTMRYLADESLEKLRPSEWQRLIKEGTILMTAATDYALPADFWAYRPDTLWPIGGVRSAAIPTTPAVWTILKSGIGINPAEFNCRFIGDRLEVQNPTSGITLRFEYFQKYPITDAAGTTAKETFTVDTDLCTLDSALFIADLKWRIKKEKGIGDWEVDRQEFETYKMYMQGVDAGARTLYPADVRRSSPQEPYNNDWVQP